VDEIETLQQAVNSLAASANAATEKVNAASDDLKQLLKNSDLLLAMGTLQVEVAKRVSGKCAPDASGLSAFRQGVCAANDWPTANGLDAYKKNLKALQDKSNEDKALAQRKIDETLEAAPKKAAAKDVIANFSTEISTAKNNLATATANIARLDKIAATLQDLDRSGAKYKAFAKAVDTLSFWDVRMNGISAAGEPFEMEHVSNCSFRFGSTKKTDEKLVKTDLMPGSGDGTTPLTEDLAGDDVVVIGYPGRDDRNDLDLQDRIFERKYYVKRLQPGTIRQRTKVQSFETLVNAMVHDASTLGGDSGAAVIPVKSGTIVALHFAGEYLKANYAVPMYELARDPRIAAEKLNFVGSVAPTTDFDNAWRSVGAENVSRPDAPLVDNCRSGDALLNAGANPKRMPTAADSNRVNASTLRFKPMLSLRGRFRPAIATTSLSTAFATISPSSPPAVDSNTLSVSNWRTIRIRAAPSAERIANSRVRAVARAINRLATFEHAINSTTPTLPNKTRSVPATSPTITRFNGTTSVPKPLSVSGNSESRPCWIALISLCA
jgi:hypothetical protein